MSFVATAVVAGAAIGGVASNNAANTQASSSRKGLALQREQFNTMMANESPYMNSGVMATNKLNNLLGLTNTGSDSGSLIAPFDAAAFKQYQDPGYQFQLQQGQQGLQNSQAANSGILSGAALKDLIGYNQGMANTSYTDAFNRFQTQQGNIYNRLSNMAQLGQNAAANSGMQGTALTGQMGQSLANIGGAQASGIVGGANAITSGLNNAITYSYMKNMMGNPGSMSGAAPSASPYTVGSYNQGLV